MKSVFIVEDNEQGMEELRQFLRERRLSVTECSPESHDEQRFIRFAFDRSCVQIFWVTRDQRIAYVNDAACRALSYTREELTCMSVCDIDPFFPGPDHADFLEHWRALKERGCATFDSSHRARDGRVYPVEIQSNYLGFEGREYSCCFVTDISERRKAEESLRESEKKFRVLSETSPTAVLLYQGEKIVYANQATERLFGYDTDALLRMNFWDWVHDERKVEVRERGLKRLSGAPVPIRYESKFVTKDGEERWLAVSAGLIEYRGKPAGIASLLDITESKRSEELLRAALAEKTVLLKEIHHRVKNNLQIVCALLDLQSDSLPDEQSRVCFQYSQDRIRSMALVHEHLYRSRDFNSIDFADYIKNLAAYLLNSHASDHGRISLKVNADSIVLGIDMSIPCGLIINELISNSLKHGFPDDRHGEVTIELSAAADGWLTLSVADTGVGFPPGIDIGNARTLGLRIVGMLVKQLRGRIEMRNDNGASCRVRFRDSVAE